MNARPAGSPEPASSDLLKSPPGPSTSGPGRRTVIGLAIGNVSSGLVAGIAVVQRVGPGSFEIVGLVSAVTVLLVVCLVAYVVIWTTRQTRDPKVGLALLDRLLRYRPPPDN